MLFSNLDIKRNIQQIHWVLASESDAGACRQTDCDIKEVVSGEPTALSHRENEQQTRWTIPEVRRIAEEIALGLRQYAFIEKESSSGIRLRAALLLSNDAYFVMAGVGCLLAQLATVPIAPDLPLDASAIMLSETAACVLFVSTLQQVEGVLSKISTLPSLKLIVVVDRAPEFEIRLQDNWLSLQWALPEGIDLITLDDLRAKTNWSAVKVQAMRARI